MAGGNQGKESVQRFANRPCRSTTELVHSGAYQHAAGSSLVTDALRCTSIPHALAVTSVPNHPLPCTQSQTARPHLPALSATTAPPNLRVTPRPPSHLPRRPRLLSHRPAQRGPQSDGKNAIDSAKMHCRSKGDRTSRVAEDRVTTRDLNHQTVAQDPRLHA